MKNILGVGSTDANIPSLRGMYYMIIGMFMYILSDIFVKVYISNIPAVEITFFRNAISALIVFFIIRQKHINMSWKNKPWLLFTRSFFGFISGVSFLYCVQNISLANAVVFVQSSAIFSSLIAFIVLRELLSKWQVLAVIVGFIGIIFIVKPDLYLNIDKNNLVGLICSLSGAIAFVSLRDLRKYYHTHVIVFTVLMTGVFFSALFMLLAEFYSPSSLNFLISKFVAPKVEIFILFIAIAIFHVASHIYRTKAYAHGKTGVIGVAGYSRVVFALIAGILLGDAYPDQLGLLGIILVVLSGIMAAYFRRGREWGKTLVDGKAPIHICKKPGWGMQDNLNPSKYNEIDESKEK